MMPKRIQRKREKGWRIADYSSNYVMIHRPFKLGNPFDWTNYVGRFDITPAEAKAKVSGNFHLWLFGYSFDGLFDRQAYLAELEKHRGKDVVCFCKPDEPCHGDVILEYWEKTSYREARGIFKLDEGETSESAIRKLRGG